MQLRCVQKWVEIRIVVVCNGDEARYGDDALSDDRKWNARRGATGMFMTFRNAIAQHRSACANGLLKKKK